MHGRAPSWLRGGEEGWNIPAGSSAISKGWWVSPVNPSRWLLEVMRIVDRLFGKWRSAHEGGKIRRRKPRDVTNAEICENVVYRGHRLLANDVAEAPFELGL